MGVAWAAATLAALLLRGLYARWPNPLTALLSPAAGQAWEPLKLLFWPCLAAAWGLTRRAAEPWRAWAGHLTALPAAEALFLCLRTVCPAGEPVWLALALGAALPAARRISARPGAGRHVHALVLAAALQAVLLSLFSVRAVRF